MLNLLVAFVSMFVFLTPAGSFAQTLPANCKTQGVIAYTEETVTTKVPFLSGFFTKEEIQVEISGVLWMPCKELLKPYPLVIYSHGSQDGGLRPVSQEGSRLMHITRTFLERDMAVFIPIRKGFNRAGTPSSEVSADSAEPVSCNNPHGNESGLQSAMSDTKALYNVLVSTKKIDLDFTRVTLVGFSRGGVLSLALAADGLPGVVRVINFVGGWANEICDGGYLPRKFQEFGRKIKAPVVSFYGTNDWYYSENFSRSNVLLLEKGGVQSTLHVIPEGTHMLINTHRNVWIPLVFGQ